MNAARESNAEQYRAGQTPSYHGSWIMYHLASCITIQKTEWFNYIHQSASLLRRLAFGTTPNCQSHHDCRVFFFLIFFFSHFFSLLFFCWIDLAIFRAGNEVNYSTGSLVNGLRDEPNRMSGRVDLVGPLYSPMAIDSINCVHRWNWWLELQWRIFRKEKLALAVSVVKPVVLSFRFHSIRFEIEFVDVALIMFIEWRGG